MKLLAMLAIVAALLLASTAWKYTDVPMHRCAWCGTPGTVFNGLNRHHILQQSLRPDLVNVETNIIVLCRRCHFVLGHRCDWRRCVPDVKTICDTFTNSLEIAP